MPGSLGVQGEAVTSSHSSGTGTGSASQWPWHEANLSRGLDGEEEPRKGLEMSQGSGRLGGGAEVLWPGHKGPVESTDPVGVWGAMEGL